MRKSVLAAAAACCVLIGLPVYAEQIKFGPGTFKIYGGMTSGQTASLYTPLEPPGISRRIVDFYEPLPAGSILIRTAERRLYYVLHNNRAIMYPVGVGREGFTWTGQDSITRKAIWPDWRPPKDMIEREAKRGHVIPAFMSGGPENPLGARALYIGDTEYRIHGTTQPWSIGSAVSSGCIRMMNNEVIDLFNRVEIGATVIVE
jgi:lipoprotein-anchoring transpeptidase ErfK/SrfK